MASAFASALEALFADAHLASDIVYIAEGGAPSLVRAILVRRLFSSMRTLTQYANS